MFLNKDYLDWDAPKLRKTLQQENWISKSYVAIDGEFGKEMYVYFRTKDQKFKPSKSQGASLNWSFFLDEASNKGLVYRSDFFLDCVDDYVQLIESGKHPLNEEMDMKEKKDEIEGGPNELQKQDGESEDFEKKMDPKLETPPAKK